MYLLSCACTRDVALNIFEVWGALTIMVKEKKLLLFLINFALRHENVWYSGCMDHVFLTSALVGGKC
jgi:hypothetical protein